MGAQWDSVMHADVFGTISNAYKLDEQNAGNNIGQYHLATAVTTTVLLASIGASSQKGQSLKQLKLCLLKPDAFQHIDIDSTVNQLENIVHYMYRSSIGGEQSYWFQSKPNINILINQAKGDVKEDAERLANKMINLRIFSDENDKINLSLENVGGELLIVSQFTLYADCRKGNRPSFVKAGSPQHAEELYEYLIERCEALTQKKPQTGEFGALMKVHLTNNGPSTMLMDSEELGY